MNTPTKVETQLALAFKAEDQTRNHPVFNCGIVHDNNMLPDRNLVITDPEEHQQALEVVDDYLARENAEKRQMGTLNMFFNFANTNLTKQCAHPACLLVGSVCRAKLSLMEMAFFATFVNLNVYLVGPMLMCVGGKLQWMYALIFQQFRTPHKHVELLSSPKLGNIVSALLRFKSHFTATADSVRFRCNLPVCHLDLCSCRLFYKVSRSHCDYVLERQLSHRLLQMVWIFYKDLQPLDFSLTLAINVDRFLACDKAQLINFNGFKPINFNQVAIFNVLKHATKEELRMGMMNANIHFLKGKLNNFSLDWVKMVVENLYWNSTMRKEAITWMANQPNAEEEAEDEGRASVPIVNAPQEEEEVQGEEEEEADNPFAEIDRANSRVSDVIMPLYMCFSDPELQYQYARNEQQQWLLD